MLRQKLIVHEQAYRIPIDLAVVVELDAYRVRPAHRDMRYYRSFTPLQDRIAPQIGGVFYMNRWRGYRKRYERRCLFLQADRQIAGLAGPFSGSLPTPFQHISAPGRP